MRESTARSVLGSGSSRTGSGIARRRSWVRRAVCIPACLAFFLAVPLAASADFGEIHDGFQDFFWQIAPLFVDGSQPFGPYGAESNIGPSVTGSVCQLPLPFGGPPLTWDYYVFSQPANSTIIAAWGPTKAFLLARTGRAGDVRVEDALADWVVDDDGDFATGPLGYLDIGFSARPNMTSIIVRVHGVIVYDNGGGCTSDPIEVSRTVTS